MSDTTHDDVAPSDAVVEAPAPPAPAGELDLADRTTDKSSDAVQTEEWTVEVDHSAYYRWQPVKASDLTWVDPPTDENGNETGPGRWLLDGETVPVDQVIESTWPDFKLRRVTVPEPTTTVTQVNMPALRGINSDREAAGLSRRTHVNNLIRHLEDGPWSRHFPLESVTAVRCTQPGIGDRLSAHFAAGGDEE